MNDTEKGKEKFGSHLNFNEVKKRLVKLKQLRDKRGEIREKTCVKKIGSHLNFNEVKKRLVKLKKEEQK